MNMETTISIKIDHDLERFTPDEIKAMITDYMKPIYEYTDGIYGIVVRGCI